MYKGLMFRKSLIILLILLLIPANINALATSQQFANFKEIYRNGSGGLKLAPSEHDFDFNCLRYIGPDLISEMGLREVLLRLNDNISGKILEQINNGYVVALSNCSVELGEKVPINFKISKSLIDSPNADNVHIIIKFAKKLNKTDIEFLEQLGNLVDVKENYAEFILKNTSDLYKIAQKENVLFISHKNYFTLNEKNPNNENPSDYIYPDYIYLISADVLLNSAFSSKNVIVAVPDSGIARYHSHFNNVSIRYGYDFVDNDYDPIDENYGSFDYGHGTHVAGIISGMGNFKNFLISGVSPDAELLVSRIFGPDLDGDSNSDDYYNYDYNGYYLWWSLLDPDRDGSVLDSDSADVISVSWNSIENYGVYDDWSKTVDDIISGRLIAKRPVFVISAGNNGNKIQVSPPATSKNSIVVGSCVGEDCSMPARYTQLGSGCGILKPDIFSPGDNIISAVPYDISSLGYEARSGTSMSTPFVSSLAAQLISTYSIKNPEFVKAMIISASYGGSTTDSKDVRKGWGRVSFYQTVYKTKDEIIDYYDTGVLGNELTPYPQERIYEFEIGENAKYLVATMVYSDESSPLGYCNVLNDLDLYLVSPNGSTYLPSGYDTKNDESGDIVEKYVVLNPIPGKWELHVNATRFNDVGKRIPKYLNYAVSLRVISKEDLTVHYTLDRGNFYIQSNSSFYGCSFEIKTASGDTKKLVVGDLPAGTLKIVKSSLFKEVSPYNYRLYCYNFTGEKIELNLVHDLIRKVSNSSIEGNSNFVERIIFYNKNKVYVVYRIHNITIGGIKDRFGKQVDVTRIYSDGLLKYNFTDEEFLASWFGRIHTIVLEVNHSIQCGIAGYYLDFSKSLDTFKIKGSTCFERDKNKVKDTIAHLVIQYILNKNDFLKEVIIKLIIYYLNL